jgi:hypothetical protein
MNEIQLIHCNECGRRTRHHIKADYSTTDSDQQVSVQQTSSVLECGGCGMISFRTRLWLSELQDGSDTPVYQDTFFPPRLDRPVPAWFLDLPDALEDVLVETYEAYFNDQRYLAAVGIRTSLDMAIVEKVGDAGTFDDKVDLLHMSGLVRAEESEMLKAALQAGHAAAHRGFRPSKADLEVMLDIVESVLHALFIKEARVETLRAAAEAVSQRVPQRERRDRRTKGPDGPESEVDPSGETNGV